MTASPSPTTDLEAVNTMLLAIGESPVNSLGGSSNVDVDLAQQVLLETSREVQTEVWSWNTEKDYTLVRNDINEIPVPANTIRVDADTETLVDVVQRGTRLYDRKNHVYTFPNNASLKVEISFLLPFDELPEPARRYIMIKAARVFLDRRVGSDELHGFTQKDEARARAILEAHETETADYTIFDSALMYYIVNRGPSRRYW